jgi:hypothetical protein
VPALIAVALVIAVISVALNDFIVPTMAVRGCPSVLAAFRVFIDEVLHVAPGTCVLYLLMRFIMSFAVGATVTIIGCLTCCIGFCIFGFPYVGTVILLPIAYFFRSYPLYFLEQFGPQWRIFPAPASAPPAPPTTPAAPAEPSPPPPPGL